LSLVKYASNRHDAFDNLVEDHMSANRKLAESLGQVLLQRARIRIGSQPRKRGLEFSPVSSGRFIAELAGRIPND
jgi:hypothetical protein